MFRRGAPTATGRVRNPGASCFSRQGKTTSTRRDREIQRLGVYYKKIEGLRRARDILDEELTRRFPCWQTVAVANVENNT